MEIGFSTRSFFIQISQNVKTFSLSDILNRLRPPTSSSKAVGRKKKSVYKVKKKKHEFLTRETEFSRSYKPKVSFPRFFSSIFFFYQKQISFEI